MPLVLVHARVPLFVVSQKPTGKILGEVAELVNTRAHRRIIATASFQSASPGRSGWSYDGVVVSTDLYGSSE